MIFSMKGNDLEKSERINQNGNGIDQRNYGWTEEKLFYISSYTIESKPNH